jgi:hypothetical protein
MSSLIQAPAALARLCTAQRSGLVLVSPVKAYLLLKDFSKWSGHDAGDITRAQLTRVGAKQRT